MALIFLNGGGMRGGPLHSQLQGAPLVRVARSAAKYRYFSVGDRFPAMDEVADGGVSVVGEVYDVPLETLRDHLIPAEPDELELGVIELDDGTACLATVLRRGVTDGLTDISHVGDWRAYRGLPDPEPQSEPGADSQSESQSGPAGADADRARRVDVPESGTDPADPEPAGPGRSS